MDNRKKLQLFTHFLNLIPYLIMLVALLLIEFDLKNKILFAVILITPMVYGDIKDGTFKQMFGKD